MRHKVLIIVSIVLVIGLAGAALYHFKLRYNDPAFQAYVQDRQYCNQIRHIETSQAQMYRDWKRQAAKGC